LKIDLAPFIDHSLLHPGATREQIGTLCEEALVHHFATVCVHPCWVPLVAELLESSDVGVCTVIDFPLGAGSLGDRRMTSRNAVRAGATELDTVMPLGLFRSGDDQAVRAALEAVVEAAQGRIVKVILETAALSDGEIDRACNLAIDAGAAFVKSSTGFGPGGATTAAIRRMRAAVGPDGGVKASGGIRDREAALSMLEAGANRLGITTSLNVVQG
jgi:deoxyribose-phosphate aldolase